MTFQITSIRFINQLPIFFLYAIVITFFSCDEKDITSAREDMPINVSQVYYESLPGKIILYFQPSEDPSVSNVKINYIMSSGKEREVILPAEESEVLLAGFTDLDFHEISIVTVNESGLESAEVSLLVKALKAPVWDVVENMKFTRALNGFDFETQNPTQDLVGLRFMIQAGDGSFQVADTMNFWTAEKLIDGSVRGINESAFNFKYFAIDELDNSTDTLSAQINPYLSTALDKSKFKEYKLPYDAPQVTNGPKLEYIWDGLSEISWPKVSFTSQELGGRNPHMITFDTGVESKLSEFWYKAYPEFWWDSSMTQWFYLTTMKRFELYGSLDPNPNGKLDDTWTLLGSYEVNKPSGSSYGNDTSEDIAYAEAGFSFQIENTSATVRYIRVVCLENYAGGTAQSMVEITLYGK